MDGIPEDVAVLLGQRDEARRAKDWARADQLRAQIDALGYEVRDSPVGASAVLKPAYRVLDPTKPIPVTRLPPTFGASIHVLYEGFRDDLERFVSSFHKHCDDIEIIVSEAMSPDAQWLEDLPSVHTLHFSSDPGWAALRNLAMQLSNGRVVCVADLSVEAAGDLITPIVQALDDPSIGIAGPWGLRTDNKRDFYADPGPEVHAVEGYLFGVRRETLDQVRFDQKFRWYRHADIDLSFQIRALGLKAVTTPPLGERHTHRAWAALDPDERDKRSRKNFNRFLARFRDAPL